MKNTAKVFTTLLVISSLIMSSTACSKLGGKSKIDEECEKTAEDFIEALLAGDYDEMIDMCEDKDEAEELLHSDTMNYLYPLVDLTLEDAEYELVDSDVDDDEATLEYKLVIKDLSRAFDDLDDYSSTLDEIECIENCEETTEVDLKVTLIEDDGDWYISNIDEVYEDFIVDEVLDTYYETRFGVPFDDEFVPTQSYAVEETTAALADNEETVVGQTVETTATPADDGIPLVYQDIIDDIISKLNDQDAMFNSHIGVSEMMSFYSGSELTDNIGISVFDFDGDGVRELVISDLTVGYSNSHNILEMYTLDAIGNAYPIITSGCARNCYYLYSQNVVLNMGSSGWAYSLVYFSNILNGELVPYLCYWSDTEVYGGAPGGADIYWYTSDNSDDVMNSNGNGTFVATDVDFDFGLIDQNSGDIYLDPQTLSDYM